jgi:hypothetical protein
VSASRYRNVGRRLFALALWGLSLCAFAQTAQEHEVKAAFLFRFLSFIEWPAQAFRTPDAPIVIGFLGADEVAGELERSVAGRSAQGRPVAVRRLRGVELPPEVHVLMVGGREAERIGAIARAAPQLLIVADGEDALERGAAIAFVPEDGRIRFAVSLAAPERSRIRISARMLAVASSVR